MSEVWCVVVIDYTGRKVEHVRDFADYYEARDWMLTWPRGRADLRLVTGRTEPGE